MRSDFCMRLCRGKGYTSDFMTYCTNKLYGLMFARELATRLKVTSPQTYQVCNPPIPSLTVSQWLLCDTAILYVIQTNATSSFW